MRPKHFKRKIGLLLAALLILGSVMQVQAQGKVKVGGSIFGGGEAARVTGNDTVLINGTAIDTIVGSVFGGGEGASANVEGYTYVSLSNGKVLTNVYGGGMEGQVGNDTKVKMTGGVVGSGTAMNVTDGLVFGGGKGSDSDATKGLVSGNTSVEISAGTVKGNVYGGGEMASVGDGDASTRNNGTAKVIVTGGTVGVETAIAQTSADKGSVFGGCLGKAGSDYLNFGKVDSAYVKIDGALARILNSVFGGGENGHVMGNTEVLVSNGIIGKALTLAERKADKNGQITQIITGNVFGGGSGTTPVVAATNTTPAQYSETAGRVYGNTKVTVNGNAIVRHAVYGGGAIASVGTYTKTNGLPETFTSGGKATVEISGNALIGPTLDDLINDGSGNLYTQAEIDSNFKYLGANEGWVFGSSRGIAGDALKQLSYADTTIVTISGNAQVAGAVFGGGENGHVQRGTNVTIDAGTIGGIPLHGVTYALAALGTSSPYYHASLSVNLPSKESETYEDEYGAGLNVTRGNVFGGGKGTDYVEWITPSQYCYTSGRVYGNTHLTVNGGAIYNKVYGGGLIASVGTFEYNDSSNEHAVTGLVTRTGLAEVTVNGGTIGTSGLNNGDVYGGGRGFADKENGQGPDEAYVGNTLVTINQPDGKTTLIASNVYGGSANGHVQKDAHVVVNGGTIGTEGQGGWHSNVFGGGGGAGRYYEEKIHGQHLSITAGRVFGNVNVEIKGGTVKNNVYGGGAIASVGTYLIGSNDPIVHGTGEITVDVTGGTIGTADATDNGHVYGSGRGTAEAPGAYPDSLSYAVKTEVNIGKQTGGTLDDVAVYGNVYGSGENGHVYETTTVNVYSGTIGYSDASGNVTAGNVFGAGSGNEPYDNNGHYNPIAGIVMGSTRVNIKGGLVRSSVYGGGEMASVYNLYTDQYGTATVNIKGGQVGAYAEQANTNVGYVYGGGFGIAGGKDVLNLANVGNTNVNIKGGYVLSGVFGGGNSGHVMNNTNIVMTDGVVGRKNTLKELKTDQDEHPYLDHIYTGSILGGGSGVTPVAEATATTPARYNDTTGIVFGNTNVTVKGGLVRHAVYGGGGLAPVGTFNGKDANNLPVFLTGTGKTTVLIDSVAFIGPSKEDLTNPTQEEFTDFFGSGIAYDAQRYADSAFKYIGGNAGWVFGAGCGLVGEGFNTMTFNDTTDVTITGNAQVIGSAYGGGENAHVKRGTNIVVKNGTNPGYPLIDGYPLIGGFPLHGTGNVYITEGAYSSSSVTFTSDIDELYTDEYNAGRRVFRGEVYGGGKGTDYVTTAVYDSTAGRVYGNTHVTIAGGTVYNRVFGGGSMASVGFFEYNATKDTIIGVKYGGTTNVTVGGGVIGSANADHSSDGRNNGDVFGGSRGKVGRPTDQVRNLAYSGNSKVTINTGARVLSNVYGGSGNGHVQGNTHVVMNGGVVGTEGLGGWHSNVYGGGGGAHRYKLANGKKKLSITSGRVYGNTKVEIKGGTVYHNVYGGGAIASVGTYDLHEGAKSPYLGGGITEVIITGDETTQTTIGWDGNENGMVFASGRGEIAPVNHFLDSLGYTAYSTVTIGSATSTSNTYPWVKGSVYGGGENGHTYLKATVNVKSGTIGCTAEEYAAATNSALPTYDPDFLTKKFPYRGNVYGSGCGTDKYDSDNDGKDDAYNPMAGLVQGETEVNIDGGYISRNVYGGGAIASVGFFTVTERHEGDTLSWPCVLQYVQIPDATGTLVNTGTAKVVVNGGHIGTVALAAESLASGCVFGSSRGDAGTRYESMRFANVKEAYVNVTENFTPPTGNAYDDDTENVIIGSVFGGGENGHVYDTTSVTITNGLIVGSVFGAGDGSATYKDLLWDPATDEPFDDSTYVHSITAGKVFGSTSVTINGGTVLHNVYGGGNLASVGKGNYVLYGEDGPDNTNFDVTNTLKSGRSHVRIYGGTIGTDGIDNGYVYGSSRGIPHASINNPKRFLYSRDYFLGYANQTFVTIGENPVATPNYSSPRIYGSVFGGGQDGHVRLNTEVVINDAKIGVQYTGDGSDIASDTWKYRGNVYGAGRGIDMYDSDGDEIPDSYCSSAGSVTRNTHVVVNGGLIYRDVYGGGSLGTVGPPPTNPLYLEKDPSLTTVDILGGTIGDANGIAYEYGGNVYGSSRGEAMPSLDRFATVKEAVVNIGAKSSTGALSGSALVNGSVYGSGENGHVNTNATVNIYGGNVGDPTQEATLTNEYCGNVFGAGNGTDTYTDGGVQKYNPLAGIVKGNTTINVEGGWVMRNMYGGGEMASVGTISNDTVQAKTSLTLSWPYDFAYASETGKATVNIKGGRIGVTGKHYASNKKEYDNGDVYGGGKGKAMSRYIEAHYANVKETEININYVNYNPTTVNPTNYKVSPSAAKGCIAGAVYAGSENGHVNGDTRVNFRRGLVGHAIYGAGKGKGKYKVSGQDTYSNTAGKVYGDTYIDIVGAHVDSAYVVRNVFGGGNLASVGKGNYIGFGETQPTDADELAAVNNSGRTYVNIYGGTIGMLPTDLTKPWEVFKDTIPYGSVFGGSRGKSWDITEISQDRFGFVNKAFVTIGDSTGVYSNPPLLYGSVYGGAQDGHVRLNTKVSVNGGEIGVKFVSPTNAAAVMGDGNHESWYWTQRGNVFGGGSGMGLYNEKIAGTYNKLAGSVLGTTKVEVKGGTIHNSVYGGGSLASVAGDPRVVISGGQVGVDTDVKCIYTASPDNDTLVYGGDVYGAGKGFASGSFQAFCEVPNTHVTINGGRVYGDVYGGGENGHVTDSTDVYITTGANIGVDATTTFDGNVFGGGWGSGYFEKNTSDPNDSTFVMYADCGRVGGNTHIEMDGGAIQGSIFGGGRLALVGVNESGNPFLTSGGAYDSVSVVNNKKVHHGLATISVSGTTTVSVDHITYSTSIGNPHGDVLLKGSDESVGDIFGSGKGDVKYYQEILAGRVANTKINITGSPRIYGAVFGGGEMASIGYWNTDGNKSPFYANSGHAEVIIGDATGNGSDNLVIGTEMEHTYDYANNKPSEWTIYDNNGKLIHTCTGNVFGGCQGDIDITAPQWVSMGRSRTANVVINGGTILSDVFGGAEQGSVAGNTKVTINGGTIGTIVNADQNNTDLQYYFGSIFGGGYGCDDVKDLNTTANDSTLRADFIAGRTYGNARVDFIGGTVYGDVYGGSDMAYIGSYGSSPQGNVTLNIGQSGQTGDDEGPTIKGNVYGANNKSGTPLGDIVVNIYHTAHTPENKYPTLPTGASAWTVELLEANASTQKYAIENVFGGGNYADFTPTILNRTDKKTTVNVYNCDNTIRTLYGGGNASDVGTSTINANTNLMVEGGRFHHVFGGGHGEPGQSADIWGTASTDIQGGLIDVVFGGSDQNGSILSTNLTIADVNSCDMLVDSIFGGSNVAPITGDITTTIACGDGSYENIYGGANNASINGNVTLNVKGNTITNVFGGSKGSVGKPANISGNVTLNLFGGTITNAFGGSDVNGNIGGVITVNVLDTVKSCPLSLDYVYGGSSNTAIKATDNTKSSPVVNILHGTVNYDVFGGSYGDTATVTSNPVVNIGDLEPTHFDTVKGNVYGGGSLASVVGNTTVNVISGQVGTIDYYWKKTTDHSKPYDTIRHTSGGHVYGAGMGDKDHIEYAKVTGNANVNIQGGHVLYNVYGGGALASVVQKMDGSTPVANTGKATVNVTGGQVGPAPKFLSKKGSATTANDSICIPIGLNGIDGYVFGGGQGIGDDPMTQEHPSGQYYNLANVASTEVIVNIPSDADTTTNRLWGSVFGGAEDGHVLGDAHVHYINGLMGTTGTTSYDGNIFGGGRNYSKKNYTAGYVGGNTCVEMTGGQLYGSIFGGGRLALTGIGEQGIIHDGYGNFQAYADGTNTGKATVKVKGGKVGNEKRIETWTASSMGDVYGGGKGTMERIEGHDAASALLISLTRNTEVEISDNAVIYGNVYGGGEVANVGNFRWKQDAEGKISDIELISDGLAKVTVSGGQIGADTMRMRYELASDNTYNLRYNDDVGHVYGGGEGKIDNPANYAVINPSTSGTEGPHNNKRLLDLMATVDSTSVIIKDDAWVKGSVYGGSAMGHVLGNTSVKIQGGQIGSGQMPKGVAERKFTEEEFLTFDSLPECVHWPYGWKDANNVVQYYTHDPIDVKAGKLPSDGHTWFGNVFGGGSGYYPYITKVDGTTRDTAVWNPESGKVYGTSTVEITGGHILTSVYGGCEVTDVLGDSTIVTMSGGTLGVPRKLEQIGRHPVTCYLFGSGKGDPRTNFNTWTNVQGVRVEVSGGWIYGSVFGGGEEGHVIKDAKVIISGSVGTKEQAIAGTATRIGTLGYSYVDGNIFGAGRGFSGEALTAGTVGGNVTINIRGGEMLGSVYGGGRLASVGTEFASPKLPNGDPNPHYGHMQAGLNHGIVTIDISGGVIGNDYESKYHYSDHTTGGNVFTGGMGRLTKLDGSINPIWPNLAKVKMTKLTVRGDAFIKSSVYGGGEFGTVDSVALVTISGGTIGRNVYGGGFGSDDNTENGKLAVLHGSGNTATVDTVLVSPMYWAGRVEGNDSISVTGGWIKKNIYGGGELASVGTIDSMSVHGSTHPFNLSWPMYFRYVPNTGRVAINVTGGRIGITGKDYFGPWNADGNPIFYDAEGNPTVYDLTNATHKEKLKKACKDNGDIYGGGKGKVFERYTEAQCANVNKVVVTIKDVTTTATPETYKPSTTDSNGKVKYMVNYYPTWSEWSAWVNANGGYGTESCVTGALYGGGENGHVNDSTSITLTRGLVGHAVYGGGKGKDTYTQLKPGSTTEYETVYSNTAGKVYGNTHVHVNGGYVVRSVFGGGNLASVGIGNYAGGEFDTIYNKDGYGEKVTEVADWKYVQNSGHTYVDIKGGTLGMLPTDPTKPEDVFKDNIPYGSVFGGCRGMAVAEEETLFGYVNYAHVTIGRTGATGPTLLGSVYGGGQDGRVRWNANTVVNSGVIGVAYDPSTAAGIMGTVNADTLYWNSRGNVFGGGSGLGLYDEDTPGTYSHIAGQVLQRTNVTVNGGTIYRNVYGGGNLATVGPPRFGDDDCPATLTGTTVNMNAPLVQNENYGGYVFGGSRGLPNNDTIQGNVHEFEAFALCSYTKVNINNGASVPHSVFGGGENGQVGTPHQEDQLVHTTEVNINSGSTVNEHVFGGGQGSWGNPYSIYDTLSGRVIGTTHVIVNNGTVNGNVYGGGALGIVMDTAKVTINAGTVNDVFGAGKGLVRTEPNGNADVAVATKVTLNDGTILGNVYGGGENGSLGMLADNSITPTATVSLNGGEVKHCAYGGGRLGFTNGETFVNVSKTALVDEHVFGGAYGTTGKVYVNGLRMVNMRGGTVLLNVYGGSYQADDALEFTPAPFATNTATEKACVVNYSGGHVYNHVFGAGYFGNTYGSTYVFVGTNAIMNAPNHTANNATGYLYNQDFFNEHKDLLIDYDVWAGADFGEYDPNTSNTFGRPTITGRSDIYIDGDGYDTQSTASLGDNKFMKLDRSVFGCGTISDAGRQGKRIMIRNYGHDITNPDTTGEDQEPYTGATRQLRSIQYADSLIVENTHINLSGRSIVNVTSSTEEYAIYTIFDKVRVVNGSSLFIYKPVRNIGSLHSNYRSGDMYVEAPTYDEVMYDELADNKDNKIRINNGTSLWVYHQDTVSGNWYYGALRGYFHMMTGGGYDAYAYARPKNSVEPGNSINDSINNPSDGGFVNYHPKYNIYNLAGGLIAAGGSYQMRYENHTPDQRAGERYFRIWHYTNTGLSTYDIVLHAIANPDNPTGFSYFSDDLSVVSLPPANKGMYYRVKQNEGIADINYGSEIRMVNAGAQEVGASPNWMYNGDDGYVYNVPMGNTVFSDNKTFMTNYANYSFGLTAIPTGTFGGSGTGLTENKPWLLFPEANATLTNANTKWVTNQSSGSPQVRFLLTHSNAINGNYRWDPLSITLEKVDESGMVMGEVEIHVTITTSTTIEQENNLKSYALMTHGGNTGDPTDVFSVKVLVPKYVLQDQSKHSTWTLKKVEWSTENAGSNTPNGHTHAAFNANTLVEGEPHPTHTPTSDYVGMTMYRTDNFDGSNGWVHTSEPVVPVDLAMYKGVSTVTDVKFGETRGDYPVSFNFDLHFDGNQNVGLEGNTKMGDLKVTAHIDNYVNGEGVNYEKDVVFNVEVFRRGKGKGYYIDGEHGDFVYGGDYPNAAQPSLAGIFNFTNFEPCDSIYIVNKITANSVDKLEWNGIKYDQLKIFRYPGGHLCTETKTHYAPYGTTAYRLENGAYKGVLVDVKSSMSVSSSIIDGAYLMEERQGYYTDPLHPLDSLMSPNLQAEAPIFHIGNGGSLTIIGGDDTYSNLCNNYNNSSNGGAIHVGLGGVLKMNEQTYVSNNFVKDGAGDDLHYGGGIYLAQHADMLVSDSVMVNTNKHVSASGNEVWQNVYLADYSTMISVGTLDGADSYGPLNAGSRIGVTKTDWRDHEIMPIVFTEKTDHYTNLLGDRIIFDEEPRYTLYEYPLRFPNGDDDCRNKLYWVRTWVDAVTSAPDDFDADHIDTPQELAWAISVVNGLNGQTAAPNTDFTITGNIDMNQYIWVPIGSKNSLGSLVRYTGDFEGNGHAVTGIHSPLPVNYKGMFGATDGANIKNLLVESSFYTGEAECLGGIIGKMSNGTLVNCEAAGYLESAYSKDNGYIGGLVGENLSGTIHSSFATDTVCALQSSDPYHMYVGGLVGKHSGNLLNSYSRIVVDSQNKTNHIAGLVAYNVALVENCYAELDATLALPAFALTNAGTGTIQYCYGNYRDDIVYIENTVGDETTFTGYGTYSPTVDRKAQGYMYYDNTVTAATSDTTYVRKKVNYAGGKISTWSGLLSTLNQWVEAKNAITDPNSIYCNQNFVTWFRPTTEILNGDLPVLAFPTGVAMASNDSDGRFLMYNNSLDRLLHDYKGKTASIFLYANAVDVTQVPTADEKVFVNEDAVLKQASSATESFINATVGVTFDNSSKNAEDYYHNKLKYDWHLLSTPLQNAKMGTTYWYHDDEGNYQPHDNDHDATVRYQTDTVDIRSMVDSYFPNDLKMAAGDEMGATDVKWDFYNYFEPEYHWINLKRNKMNHFHQDAHDAVYKDKPYQLDIIGGPNYKHYQIDYTGTDQSATTAGDENCVFTPGKGYMMAISQDSYLSSTGALNKEVTIQVTAQAPEDPLGWQIHYNKGVNLVGNPYQAYLDLDTVSTKTVNIGLNRFWVYDADQDNYVPYIKSASNNPRLPSRYIHPHQGFFVITDSDQTMTFTPDMAGTDTDAGSYYRSRPSYPLVNLLVFDESGNSDLAIVEFNRPKTGGVQKIESMKNADFNLYAHFEDDNYGLLFTPEGTKRVPVFFKTPNDGKYTLTWDRHNGTFKRMRLIDNITGEDYDMLTHDHYTFDAFATDFAARFYIVFDVEGGETGDTQIFAHPVGTGWLVEGQGVIQLVDVLGHVFYSDYLTGETTVVSFGNVAAGTYMLKLGDKTQKIVIY